MLALCCAAAAASSRRDRGPGPRPRRAADAASCAAWTGMDRHDRRGRAPSVTASSAADVTVAALSSARDADAAVP